jgi:hypothetical protein
VLAGRGIHEFNHCQPTRGGCKSKVILLEPKQLLMDVHLQEKVFAREIGAVLGLSMFMRMLRPNGTRCPSSSALVGISILSDAEPGSFKRHYN